MSDVVIHKAAAIRLGEIWDYTVGEWGEAQADAYLRKLDLCIRSLQTQRTLWRGIKDPRLPDVFFVRCGHHFIFFRASADQVAVISVLHERMDMLERLREDTRIAP
jgi:toxin ParE1/3/4